MIFLRLDSTVGTWTHIFFMRLEVLVAKGIISPSYRCTCTVSLLSSWKNCNKGM